MDVVFLLYMGNLQLSLSKSSTKSIKSNYYTEDMVNRIIYDENKFNEYFVNTILTESRGYFYDDSITQVQKDIVKNENFSSCKIKIDKETKKMNLTLNHIYNDIKTIFEININLVNEIFDMGNPIINLASMEGNERESCEEYFNFMEEEIFRCEPRLDIELSGVSIYRYNILDNAKILIDDNRKVLYDLENNIEKNILNFTNQILLLNIKSLGENNNIYTSLELGEEKNLEKIKLKGVLYIEGDLIINQDLDFEGVIVINNGNLFVENDINVKIMGIILYRGEEDLDLESIDVIYDKNLIYTYGSYLPGYINPRVELIKIL